jgi:hypothetical protein
MLLIRGCATSGNPFDVVAGSTIANSTSISFPAVTTTVNDCEIIQIVTYPFDSFNAEVSGQANAALANITEPFDFGDTTGNGGGFAVTLGEKAVAGAVGNTTATLANTGNMALLTIAMRPPVASISAKITMINYAVKRAANY